MGSKKDDGTVAAVVTKVRVWIESARGALPRLRIDQSRLIEESEATREVTYFKWY